MFEIIQMPCLHVKEKHIDTLLFNDTIRKVKHSRTVWQFSLFLFIIDEVSLLNPMHFSYVSCEKLVLHQGSIP